MVTSRMTGVLCLIGLAGFGGSPAPLSAQEPQPWVTLRAPAHSIRMVVFSPDGKTLLTAGWDKVGRVWDPAVRQVVKSHDDNRLTITDGIYSPDGNTVALCVPDEGIRLWDLATGKTALMPLGEKAKTPVEIAFSPDGKLLASSNSSSGVTLWDLKALKQTDTTLGDPGDGVIEFVFAPDGKTVIAGDHRGAIKVWDVATGKRVREFPGHMDPITTLAVSPDGKTVAAGSLNGSVALWNLETGKVRAIAADKDEECPFALRFSPDGRRLAWANSPKGTVTLYDLRTRRVTATIPFGGEKKESVLLVAFSPDGRTLAAAGTGHDIRLWKLPPPPEPE